MARKTKKVKDNSDPESDDGEMTHFNLEETFNAAVKEAVNAAKRKAAAISKEGHKNIDSVLEKYRHMVEVTHKAELEEWYARFRADLAKEDEIIANANKELRDCSIELEAVLADFAREQAAILAEEERMKRGFLATIKDLIEKENEAVTSINVSD